MRTKSRSAMWIRCCVIACALLGAASTQTAAWADGAAPSGDPRADAKAHYQAGTKLYAGGNYKDAVKEFTTAESLAPSGYNDYNLALCYDKLGEAGPAIQYYQSYLKRVPEAANKAAVDASVARLDAAAKSAEGKKAADDKKIADAKAAADAKKAAADEKAAQGARAAQAAADAEAAKHADAGAVPMPAGPAGPATGDIAAAPPATGMGSTGTPGTGATVVTGDAQLDRVSAVDINSLREQRGGSAPAPSTLDMRGGGTTPTVAAGAQGPAPTQPGAPNQPVAEAKPTPIYKKWWFWVVVAVGAYVIYSVATTSSSSSSSNVGRELPLGPQHAEQTPGGYTLLRW